MKPCLPVKGSISAGYTKQASLQHAHQVWTHQVHDGNHIEDVI